MSIYCLKLLKVVQLGTTLVILDDSVKKGIPHLHHSVSEHEQETREMGKNRIVLICQSIVLVKK